MFKLQLANLFLVPGDLTLNVISPLFLMSVPDEVKDPTQGGCTEGGYPLPWMLQGIPRLDLSTYAWLVYFESLSDSISWDLGDEGDCPEKIGSGGWECLLLSS